MNRNEARLAALEAIRSTASDVARHLAVMFSPDDAGVAKEWYAITLRASSLPHLEAALEAERRLYP